MYQWHWDGLPTPCLIIDPLVQQATTLKPSDYEKRSKTNNQHGFNIERLEYELMFYVT